MLHEGPINYIRAALVEQRKRSMLILLKQGQTFA